ncbi:hypothetical protein ACS0TY_007851 [Phlomoides rotata]
MSLLRFILLTLSLAFVSAFAATIFTDSPPTVYEVLESYGFPIGILPKGVSVYEFDSATGKFSVHLNTTCSFTIQGYDLKYKSTVTGTISRGKIRNLDGIQVKILLFWVNIIEVTMDGGDLELSVGIASAAFPVDSFYESPQCGCGFDCAKEGKSNRDFSFKKLFPLFEL